MRIDSSLLHFCATKTREIVQRYNQDCIFPDEAADEGYPRSADDLHLIVMEGCGKPIYHRQLRIHKSAAKYRSFYKPYSDRCEVYYARGLDVPEVRYYKTKELLQLHLWQESMRTTDVVELVQNMILRASPESAELDLGHAATSDTLGDIAAMEFLFPIRRRLAYSQKKPGRDGIAELAKQYGIPPFVIQRAFNTLEVLTPYFDTKQD